MLSVRNDVNGSFKEGYDPVFFRKFPRGFPAALRVRWGFRSPQTGKFPCMGRDNKFAVPGKGFEERGRKGREGIGVEDSFPAEGQELPDRFKGFSGSAQSTSSGRPVLTPQKPQDRVQTFPRIMKVAVPSPQHSPIFGQLPEVQMVCRL